MSHPTGQLALMIDLERCTGCKSCEAACKQSNALGPHSYRNRVMWFDQTDAGPQNARLDFLTVTCQQCERPACVRACPVNPTAIHKDPQTGVVAIDPSRCTGCGECGLSCPYGAIGYDPRAHHAVKCDLCANRRERGEPPACASVCPTRAISFGKRSDLLAAAQNQQREPLDVDHFLQNPATVYLKRLRDADKTLSPTESLQTPELMRDHQVRRLINSTRQSFESANSGAGSTTGQVIDDTISGGASSGKQIIDGGCHICFNACPVQYHLQDGQITHVFGNPNDPVFQGRVCAKSQMTLQSYAGSDRLTRPLKRIGQPGASGAENFVEISWNQALDEIADRLKQVRSEHGAEALAIHAGSRTGTLNLIGFIPMFAGLWGTANTASTEPFCDLSKTVAMIMTQGNAMLPNVYTERDIGSADLHVFIGDNQAETRPVNFGLVNDWRLRRGARMIVVDPRFTVTASKADQWLAISPGTDMALGLALIHQIFLMDLHDQQFCETWITGWEQWRDFIAQRHYSPEWAARITGLESSQITRLASDIAHADGCMLYLSRGINQHSNAGQTNRVFMFLAAITGNWGRPGGGYFNVNAELEWVNPPLPADRTPAKRPAISKNPAAWVPAMLGQAPYPIRALITGNNPLAQWPDQTQTRAAFAGLDLLVHMDLYRNATSAWAHYVLPMATGIEKGGPTRFAEDRRIIWNDPLVQPPGQARSDHWFWIELGKRLGFGDILRDEYKDPAYFFDHVLVAHTPVMRGINTTVIKSQPARNVRVPFAANPPGGGEADDPVDTLYQEGTHVAGHPAGKRFPTASGTLEFFTAELDAQFASLGLSALPEFYGEPHQRTNLPHLIERPNEQGSDHLIESPFVAGTYTRRVRIQAEPDRPIADNRFDTDLITGRPPAPHFHSWTHYFWQAQEMWPELFCQIHPDKASELDIADGDMVQLETDHGKLTARAWLHRGIRRDAVFVPIGWDEYQPFHPASTVNGLTGVTLDPVSQQANLKAHPCRVSRP